jgi:hypothetical protein
LLCPGHHCGGQVLPLPHPAHGIETRENLAALKVAVLELLAVCGAVSPDQLWSLIDFVMTDSVTHNLEVEQIVSKTLETDHVPGHLLCHVHPSLMFGRTMTNTWQETDATIGVSKIFAGFAVILTDVQVSFTEQWINTSLRLVTQDFDHKFWNYANQFDLFINPKVNPAKRLQKERFNSLTYCCLIAIYLDRDILAFLDKYMSITNTLACIIHPFSSLEYIRILV